MIVKNESAIIERLLASVEQIIDSFCIHDTGSTDDTVEKIHSFSKRSGVQGKVASMPFVNFGVNRTAALLDAKPMADFILLLDADMQLVIDPKFTKSVLETADAFLLQQGNDAIHYCNARIIRSTCAVNYSGVTHEHVNTKAGARVTDLPLLRITDFGDGGSKSDKFERDIKLLVQGIEDEPTNERYYFYLANSYMDTKQYEKAIDFYQKRIQMGGWGEEVYYSMYKMASALKALGRHDEFVSTSIKAWTYRPKRIESVYELVKYFREMSNYEAAKGFYLMVKGTPMPPDTLFVHKNVYDYALDYEYSLLAYYAGDFNAYPAYKSLFSSPLNLYAQFNNYKFYAPTLKGNVVKLGRSHAVTLDGKQHNMKGSTPSILAVKDGYVVNVRMVNYTIANGEYEYQHDVVLTENKRLKLNRKLEVVKETMLETRSLCKKPDGWSKSLKGVEDVKLANIDGEVVFTGTTVHKDGRIGMCCGTYGTILKPVELTMKSCCEKNWVFLPNRREMVYGWHPLRWGNLTREELELTNERPMPKMFEMARGSCNGVEFENEWWFVVHFVHKNEKESRFYYHSIVVFDKQMKLKRWTYPFKFSKTPIEFCLGMVVEPGRLLLTHSMNDCDGVLLVVERSVVDTLWM